ncbi:MAG: hypothetical protein K8R88_00875 [Armatimonadetes bacterium]|nr:hypothetical protein [Armatimonadota bacterium]
MFDPEKLIPIVAILMVFGVPMMAILTHHQRKMAELMHSRANQADAIPQLAGELQMLREEVRSLRDQMNQQILKSDYPSAEQNLQGRQTPPPLNLNG